MVLVEDVTDSTSTNSQGSASSNQKATVSDMMVKIYYKFLFFLNFIQIYRLEFNNER